MRPLQLPPGLAEHVFIVAKRPGVKMGKVIWNKTNRPVHLLQEALHNATEEERLDLLEKVFTFMKECKGPNILCHQESCHKCFCSEHFTATKTLLHEAEWLCPKGDVILALWQNPLRVSNIKPDKFEMEFSNNGLFYVCGSAEGVKPYVELVIKIFGFEEFSSDKGIYAETKLYTA